MHSVCWLNHFAKSPVLENNFDEVLWKGKQETAKDDMAGLQSGNKI